MFDFGIIIDGAVVMVEGLFVGVRVVGRAVVGLWVGGLVE